MSTETKAMAEPMAKLAKYLTSIDHVAIAVRDLSLIHI